MHDTASDPERKALTLAASINTLSRRPELPKEIQTGDDLLTHFEENLEIARLAGHQMEHSA